MLDLDYKVHNQGTWMERVMDENGLPMLLAVQEKGSP
jgi:hypothetical protein